MALLTFLGLSGSLRRQSLNRALLRAVEELAPAGVAFAEFELRPIPPYDADVEAQGDPPAVRRLKDAIAEADAVLIATPEYNGSIPGVLKNALDWASRPYGENVLRDKLVAVMGASPGRRGTAQAQADLRRVLGVIGAEVLDGPAVDVGSASRKIAPDGGISDPATRDQVRDLVRALVAAAGGRQERRAA